MQYFVTKQPKKYVTEDMRNYTK